MCIAIVKPKDKTISEARLRTCFENNPDGCGFAYLNGTTIYIRKFMEFEDFYKEYSAHEHDSNMLIHFRIATHGGVNLENCHPFKLNDRMALVHNGIISGYGDKATKSDTRDFIDKVLNNISWKMWKNEAFRTLVGDAIGYSKFGILDVYGNTYIINEHCGVYDDGVWYSNKSYEQKKVKVTTTKNYKYNDYDYDYSQYLGGSYWWSKYYKDKEDDTNEKSLASSKSVSKKKEEEPKATTKEEWGIIYKCQDCDKEFEVLDDTNLYRPCPSCGKYNTIDIGWTENGSKFYYDSVDKKAKV